MAEAFGEEIIEMFWKCKRCQTVCPGVSGKEDESLKCTKCGAQKSDEEWLMPDDPALAPAIADECQLAFAKAGKNWKCEWCGCEERNLHGECSVCGGKKPEQAPTSVASSTHAPVQNVPPVSTTHVSVVSQVTPVPPVESVCETPRRSSPMRVIGLVMLLGGLLFGGTAFIHWLTSPNVCEASVSLLSWSRTERLYEQHTSSASNWRSEMRSGAFNVQCQTRLRGYERCHPHNCNPTTVLVDCRCTGGDRYQCNPHTVMERCNCTGGDRYRCNPRRGTCRSNGNGTATCPTVWETCVHPTVCQQCPRTVYETCVHPRVCEKCPETHWQTCYDQCPVNESYCSYQYSQ